MHNECGGNNTSREITTLRDTETTAEYKENSENLSLTTQDQKSNSGRLSFSTSSVKLKNTCTYARYVVKLSFVRMTQKDGDLSVRDEDIQIPSFDTKIFCS